MSTTQLSVVIPAFNEAARLPTTLEGVRAYLEAGASPSWEIIVVDDGSSDGTAALARERGGDRTRVLCNERNRGKGYSVRRGMLEARGEHRLMCDADLSTPIEELGRLRAAAAGADVVIASRAHPESQIEVHQAAFRENVGRAFNVLVRLTLLPELHDTQCGFKLFHAAAAVAAFEPARLDGFAFDVEALFLARRRGFVIREVPTIWRNDAATRVTTLRGMLAFADVLRVRWYAWRGLYGPPAGTA